MSTFDAELVRELRAVPIAAPAELRERVRALGEPHARRALPTIQWRRAMLVVVPACLAALLAAAAVHGLLSSGTRAQKFAASTQTSSGESGATAQGRRVLAPYAKKSTTLDRAGGSTYASIPGPNPARHQDYEADVRVRVGDLDALGRQTAAAMQITRQLGGYVASVDQSTTAGQPGEADLVLRVPVAHVQDALVRFASLGTVLQQHVSIVDLENVVQQQRQRIRALRLQIVRLTAALQGSLPADVRLRLQFLLDDARRNLAAATGVNKSTLRTAALSRVSLALTTQHVVAAKHHKGRVATAVSGAVDFLAGAGAVALAALIVLAPLAVLIVLAWSAARAWRRREERRLLAET